MEFRMEIHLEARSKGSIPLETAVVFVFVFSFLTSSRSPDVLFVE